MEKDAKEGKSEEKVSKEKKIIVILIVTNIVLVGFVVVWYFYLRPWSILDVASSANLEINKDDEFFAWDMEVENPGFSHELAGKSKIVKGIITDISSYETTLGPITYYELDNYSPIRLLEWDYPRFEIGNEVEKKVYFEWSQWNNDKNVYSPQLDFPTLGYTPEVEEIMNRVSCAEGLILELNSTSSFNTVKLTVFTPRGEGFPLELFSCSLKPGDRSWHNDYIDAGRGSHFVLGRDYEDLTILDSIDSISNDSGENNITTFSDANNNGLLDNGDYFTFNLSIPDKDSAVLTYVFSINGGARSQQRSVLYGLAYIVMTNKGVLRYLSSITNNQNLRTYLIPRLHTEQLTPNGITSTIYVTQVIGALRDISRTFCSILILNLGFSGHYEQLINGIVIDEHGIIVEFTDNNNNGLLDKGDFFEVSGLDNLTEYYLKVCTGIMDEQQIFVDYSIMETHWQTGIGAFTGNFPVIDFSEPQLVENQDDSTFNIEIDRMYGIPGINLTDMRRSKWPMIILVSYGQELLFCTNLTFDLVMYLNDVRLSFKDTDENAFINSGDSFIFQTNATGEYILIMDYVEYEPDIEEGYEIIYSQSITWTVS
jgi:hypothetical protein